MATSFLVLLFIIAFLTSTLSAVVGMGGGITLLAAMTFIFSWRDLVPLHGIVQLTSNTARAYFLFQYVRREFFLKFLIGVPLGAVLATILMKKIEIGNYPIIFIVALIIYTVFKPKKLPPLIIPQWAFSILGSVATFLSIFVGATGPLLAPFFLRNDFSKEEIIATKAASQFVVHIVKIPTFLYLGFDYFESWPLLLTMIVATIIGTKFGVRILKKIDEKLFKRLYKTFLFLAAIRLCYQIISG